MSSSRIIPEGWQKLYDHLLNAEELYPVKEWKYRGIDLWPIVRSYLLTKATGAYFSIKTKVHDTNLPAPKTGRLFLLRRRFRNYLNLAKLTAKAMTPSKINWPDSDYYFFGNRTAAYELGEHYVQNHIDPYLCFLASNDFSCSSFIHLCKNHEKQVQNAAASSQGLMGLTLKVYLLARLNRFKALQQLPGFEDFMQGVAPLMPKSYRFKLREIDDVILRTYYYSKFFHKKWKNNKNLKGVFNVCYYTPLGFAINHTCSQLNLVSVDVQHGVQGESHHAYNWPSLKNQKPYNTLPKQFIVWGESEKSVIKKWADPRSIVVHLSQTSWKFFLSSDNNMNSQFYPIEKIRETLRTQKNDYQQIIPKNKNFVLFTCQDVEDMELLRPYLRPLFELGYFVGFRLHPRDMNNPEKVKIAATKLESQPELCDFQFASKLALPVLLSLAEAHMTRYSSTVLEAAAFDVPSIVADSSGIFFYGRTVPSNLLNEWKPESGLDTLVEILRRECTRRTKTEPAPLDLKWLTELGKRGDRP